MKAILAGLCGLALLGTGCQKAAPVLAKQDAGPLLVKTAPVSSRQVRRVVDSVGTLYPFDETIVSAEVDGKVEQVNVDLGDTVQAGQVMVRLSEEEQKYVLQQNEASLRQSFERLGLKSEKDRVKNINDTPDVRRAQADLTDAEQRLRRTQGLYDQKIGALAELDQARVRLQATQAALDQAVNQTRNLIQDVERVRAQLDFQRKKMRDTSIRAPWSGAVKERQVTKGQFVKAQTPLLTLVKIDPIRLRLEVPERMAPWVRNGQIAEVSVEAFAERKFNGKVWRISPTVDQTKRTFVVEVLINNPQGALKPGSYAKASLPTDRVETIHLIPRQSVNYVFGSNKAYVVRRNVVETRELKLGDNFAGDVEVIDGVKQGEQVAISQLNRLDSGTKVSTARPN